MTDARRLACGFPFWGSQAVPFFLVISAFLLAGSSDMRDVSLRGTYLTRRMLRRFVRVAVPYTVVAVPMYAGVMAFGGLDAGSPLGNPLVYWLVGGSGPGGYYVPVLFQLYLLFPVMAHCFGRRPVAATVATVGADMAFEAVTVLGVVPTGVYRLCVLRYLAILVAGMWVRRLWDSGSLEAPSLALKVGGGCSMLLGVAYLTGIAYLGLTPLSAPNGWQLTAWPAALYVWPLLALAVSREARIGRLLGRGRRTVTKLSAAALHVFLFQMFWYVALTRVLSPERWGYGLAPFALELVVCLVACVGLGYAFYLVDSSATRRLRGRI